MRSCGLALLILFSVLVLAARADDPAKPSKEDPAHDELRALKKEVEKAIAEGDLDKLLTFLDDQVVVTYMDARTVYKPAGVKAYFEEKMKGEKRIVNKYTPSATVDELTHLYDNTGIATGKSEDTYELKDGREFQIKVRWTAALVKKGEKWKITALHSSANVFDNPILTIAVRKASYWMGGLAGGVGLLLGFILSALFRRGKT